MNTHLKFRQLSREDIEAIVVHHTATRPSQDIGVREIDQWHRKRGWLACGYHFIIRRDGSIEPGRLVTQQGAHVAGFNHVSLGVAMVGGLNEETGETEDNFTDAQYRSLKALKLAIGGGLMLKPHKYYSATECCAVDLRRVD